MENLNPKQVLIDSDPAFGRYNVYVIRRSGERLWLLDCVGDERWREIPHPGETISEEQMPPSFWVPWDLMPFLFDAIAAKGFKPKTLEAELAATKRHLDDALMVRDRLLGILESQPIPPTVEVRDG